MPTTESSAAPLSIELEQLIELIEHSTADVLQSKVDCQTWSQLASLDTRVYLREMADDDPNLAALLLYGLKCWKQTGHVSPDQLAAYVRRQANGTGYRLELPKFLQAWRDLHTEAPPSDSIWVVIQEGGSSTEHYCHAFNSERQAQGYITTTTPIYECQGPFEVSKDPIEAAAYGLWAIVESLYEKSELGPAGRALVEELRRRQAQWSR